MDSVVISKRVVGAYGFLCFLIFLLIVLGGAVRTMNAGLACPDWPLCFGDIIPDYHPQVYLEFMHRALAGVVALLFVGLNIKVLVSFRPKRLLKILCWASFIILLIQIVLGGLTVLMQLHPKVVALHLTLGLSLFSCGLWIFMSLQSSLQSSSESPSPKEVIGAVGVYKTFKRWTWSLFFVVCGQIILGGLVASHYAALVCMDFPFCHGELIPTFSGIIGLQVIHRLGAYVTFLMVLLYFFYSRQSCNRSVKRLGTEVLCLTALQVALGISNIFLMTPPLLSVCHLGVATLILWRVLKLVHIGSLASPSVTTET